MTQIDLQKSIGEIPIESGESIFTVFLKDGKEIIVPFEESAEFIEKNRAILEPRRIQVRGQRRKQA